MNPDVHDALAVQRRVQEIQDAWLDLPHHETSPWLYQGTPFYTRYGHRREYEMRYYPEPREGSTGSSWSGELLVEVHSQDPHGVFVAPCYSDVQRARVRLHLLSRRAEAMRFVELTRELYARMPVFEVEERKPTKAPYMGVAWHVIEGERTSPDWFRGNNEYVDVPFHARTRDSNDGNPPLSENSPLSWCTEAAERWTCTEGASKPRLRSNGIGRGQGTVPTPTHRWSICFSRGRPPAGTCTHCDSTSPTVSRT